MKVITEASLRRTVRSDARQFVLEKDKILSPAAREFLILINNPHYEDLSSEYSLYLSIEALKNKKITEEAPTEVADEAKEAEAPEAEAAEKTEE